MHSLGASQSVFFRPIVNATMHHYAFGCPLIAPIVLSFSCRVVASSGGLMQMGQGWDHISEDLADHLKLGPDAVVYQAPPQSMTTCRYWIHEPDYRLYPSDVHNMLEAPVGGTDTSPSKGARLF
jgi:hypothetical protein